MGRVGVCKAMRQLYARSTLTVIIRIGSVPEVITVYETGDNIGFVHLYEYFKIGWNIIVTYNKTQNL